MNGKKGFLKFGLLFAMTASISQATTILVPGASWATFSIDMDGNGQTDFVGVSTASSNITGNFYSDRLSSALTGPTFSFDQYTGRWVSAATPASVNLNGTWTVPTLLRSINNNLTTGFGFYNNLNGQSYYTLMVGNSGLSNDPVKLIAFYVDGRDYFLNNANPIKFHYGVYEPLTATAGSNTATVDFASLSVPEPSSTSLLMAGIGGLVALRLRRKS